MRTILIVEDDVTFGMMLKSWLGKKGFQVLSASNVARARKLIEKEKTDIILSDMRLPDDEGTSLLKWTTDRELKIPFILMTSYADIQSAVHTMKLGADDYIAKPFNPEELLKKINEALAASQKRPLVTKAISFPPPTVIYLEGESEAAQKLFNYVRLVAPTSMSVLINGASGTGKEYVARRIHELSNRRDMPFIPIDCGSIPKELAASEFFGHMKGSFTGALTDKTGAFIEANGGTIFLDEIGNLGYEVQIQLLRALQERKIRPIGSNKETQVDIRLISATNENLDDAITKGTFREDLYHRINEFTLHIPALRERQEDIPLFAKAFLEHAANEFKKDIKGFDDQASAAIMGYHWPGNLRQMKNVIKKAALLASGEFITLSELDEELTEQSTQPTNNVALYDEEAERNHIIDILRRTGNNKSKAAQLLNIDRKTLYNKMKLYGIDV